MVLELVIGLTGGLVGAVIGAWATLRATRRTLIHQHDIWTKQADLDRGLHREQMAHELRSVSDSRRQETANLLALAQYEASATAYALDKLGGATSTRVVLTQASSLAVMAAAPLLIKYPSAEAVVQYVSLCEHWNETVRVANDALISGAKHHLHDQLVTDLLQNHQTKLRQAALGAASIACHALQDFDDVALPGQSLLHSTDVPPPE